MRFISAEMFLKADNTVKEKLIKWWKPSVGDLVESKMTDEVICLCSIKDVESAKKFIDLDRNISVIPLFTVGQLIEFIEDCTEWPITITSLCGDYIVDPMPEYEAEFYSKKENNADAPKWWLEEKCFFEHDLLLALWECAQEVCK